MEFLAVYLVVIETSVISTLILLMHLEGVLWAHISKKIGLCEETSGCFERVKDVQLRENI